VIPAVEEAERALAAMPDWGERIPLAEDPDLGWALQPGARFQGAGITVRINNRGERGPDLPPRAPGEQRLLAVGDSSIFGDGVEESEVFLSLAARILEQAWGVEVSAVNLGVPGYDSSQSARLLEREGPREEPTWVVVGNLWSDVYRADRAPGAADARSLLPLRPGLRRLASYRLLRRLLEPALIRHQVGWAASDADIGEEGATRTSLRAYMANLRAMAATTERLGGRVAYLVLPAPTDLDVLPPPATIQAFRAAMRRVAAERHAPVLDGPALFSEAENGLGLFKDHVHPNARGHLLLGVGLADLLKDEGPGPPD
jgi:lysophospholipase L1-like esterase